MDSYVTEDRYGFRPVSEFQKGSLSFKKVRPRN